MQILASTMFFYKNGREKKSQQYKKKVVGKMLKGFIVSQYFQIHTSHLPFP